MPPTIRADHGITILINIFTVEPENRPALIALLREGTENWIRKTPGFVSASLHKSKDGRRVIYGQLSSPEAQRIGTLAKMEAITCEVSDVHV